MVTQVRGAQQIRVMHAVSKQCKHSVLCRLRAVSRNRRLAHSSSSRGPLRSQAHQSHHCAVSADCAAPADVVLLQKLLSSCRHAGYQFCGHVMAYAYRHVDPAQV